MSSKKIAKTNAARLLERLEIPFTLHQADVDESDLSAVTMAHKLGVDPGCVFKTLVARGDKTGVIMACIPAAAELNLKALATASGNKHVEMVHLKEVLPLTGYIRGGCSPLAAKKDYPVFLDEHPLGADLHQRRTARGAALPFAGRPVPGHRRHHGRDRQ